MLVASLLGYTATTWIVAQFSKGQCPCRRRFPIGTGPGRDGSLRQWRPGFRSTDSWMAVPTDSVFSSGGFCVWAISPHRPAPQCFAGDVSARRGLPAKAGLQAVFHRDLAQYVTRGGKLLVLDSYKSDKAFIEDANQLSPTCDQLDEPAADELSEHATTNDLFEPFQMAVDRSAALQGTLRCAHGLPAVATSSALQVSGGEPFAWIAGHAVSDGGRWARAW